MTPYVSKSCRSSYFNCREIDVGVNWADNNSYVETSIWGRKYFKGNFDKLVGVKTIVDPSNFFKNEHSMPTLLSWRSAMTESKVVTLRLIHLILLVTYLINFE